MACSSLAIFHDRKLTQRTHSELKITSYFQQIKHFINLNTFDLYCFLPISCVKEKEEKEKLAENQWL